MSGPTVELDSDGDETVLAVFNPLEDAVGNYSSELEEFVEDYDGTTVRIVNSEYNPEPVETDLYDDTFYVDSEGVEEDGVGMLRNIARRIEYAGSPVEDIASMYDEFHRLAIPAGHRIVADKTFYGEPPRPNEIRTDSGLKKVSELLEEEDREVEEQFEELGLEALLSSARHVE